MNNKWKLVLVVALAIIILFGPPFLWALFFPNSGYGMMGYGYGWHMPMTYSGFGMTPFNGVLGFGMMLFMWLISLASFVLIGLGIAWLVKALSAPK